MENKVQAIRPEIRCTISLSAGMRKGQKDFYKGYCSSDLTLAQLVDEHRQHSVASYLFRSGTTSGGEFCAGHRSGDSVMAPGNVMMFDFDNKGMTFEGLKTRLAGRAAAITPSKSWSPKVLKFHVFVVLDRELPMDKAVFDHWHKAVAQWLGVERSHDPCMSSWVQQLAPYWMEDGPTWVGDGAPLDMDQVLGAYVTPEGVVQSSGSTMSGHLPDDWVLKTSSGLDEIPAADVYSVLAAMPAGQRHLRVHCGKGIRHDGRADTAFVKMHEDGTAVYHCSGGRCGETLVITEPFEPVVEDCGPTEVIERIEGEDADPWDRYWMITSLNKVRDRVAGLDLQPAAFNNAVLPWDRRIAGDVVVPGVAYLSHTGRVADCLVYAPHAGGVFTWQNRRCVNTYKSPDAMPGVAQWRSSEAWRVVEGYILNMFARESDARLVMQWLGYQAQHPGKKLKWAPIICGIEGDGKSTLANLLRCAMGHDNVRDVSADALFSSFTSYREGACVNVLEEIRVSGHNRKEIMDKLKPAITNPVVEVIRKGHDGIQVPNVTNYLALTNHADALALSEGDRRWGVLYTRFKTREQLLAAFDDAYWDAVHAAYQQSPEVVRGWLLSIDLTGFPIQRCPEDMTHKKVMVNAAKSDERVAVDEILSDLGKVVTAEQVEEILSTTYKIRGLSLIRVGRMIGDCGYEKVAQLRCADGHRRRFWVAPGVLDGVAAHETKNLLYTIYTNGSD